MEMVYGLVADYAALGAGGKPTVVGIFERVFCPTGSTDIPLPTFFLLAALEASIMDGTDHQAELRLVDGDGRHIAPPITLPPVRFIPQGPGLPLRANLLLQFAGVIVPVPGAYQLEIYVQQKRIGVIPIGVHEHQIS